MTGQNSSALALGVLAILAAVYTIDTVNADNFIDSEDRSGTWAGTINVAGAEREITIRIPKKTGENCVISITPEVTEFDLPKTFTVRSGGPEQEQFWGPVACKSNGNSFQFSARFYKTEELSATIHISIIVDFKGTAHSDEVLFQKQ